MSLVALLSAGEKFHRAVGAFWPVPARNSCVDAFCRMMHAVLP